jgi:hypothetical protein
MLLLLLLLLLDTTSNAIIRVVLKQLFLKDGLSSSFNQHQQHPMEVLTL